MIPRSSFLFALLAVLGLPGCSKDETPAAPPPPSEPVQETAWTPLVDGQAVLKRTKAILDWGPRPPGSADLENVRTEIRGQLAEIGIRLDQVREQRFTEKTPSPPTPGTTEFVNLIAAIPGRRPEGIALAAHYESKRFDEFRFVGANDAAAAVALMLEIGKVLAGRAQRQLPECTTYLLFFDGEEAFVNWQEGNDHTYGSRYMAAHREDLPLRALILLDMVGSKGLLLADDRNSDYRLKEIFKSVSREVFGHVIFAGDFPVTDDHLSFTDVGIPAIDLIDHDFEQSEWWHRPTDTLDRLDSRSLEKVGTLVLTALPRVETLFCR